MKKNSKKAVWLVGCAFLAWFAVSHHRAEKERTLRMAEAEAARSVSVLPAGVEEAWLLYIKGRFSEEIQREGNNLKVRTTYIGAEPSYTYVSLNHPYNIDCNDPDGFGISVSFGKEESSPSANITGMFSPDFKNEPQRGVSPGSIASKNLDEMLCRWVADQLVALTGQSTHP